MVLHVLRALFVLLMASVGYYFVQEQYGWWMEAIAVTVAVFFLCVDILAPRQKLMIFAGSFFGLIVGMVMTFALSFAVGLLVDQYRNYLPERLSADKLTLAINLLIGVVMCYLSISFIMQTKDDFRFIIPYVEFAKQTRGARPIVLDTNVLIDGRINDVVASGIIDTQLIVPRFVLHELQLIADSSEKLKRNRGRRGLDVLATLKGNRKVDVIEYDSSGRKHGNLPVDEQLMELAKDLNARMLTNDFNLNKVAQLRGVDVININDLANALKPVVLPGERMVVRIVKSGESAGQGVGYLDDGTMVVVEQARNMVGSDVEFNVTNTMQTSAGKMIFGRLSDAETRRPDQLGR